MQSAAIFHLKTFFQSIFIFTPVKLDRLFCSRRKGGSLKVPPSALRSIFNLTENKPFKFSHEYRVVSSNDRGGSSKGPLREAVQAKKG